MSDQQSTHFSQDRLPVKLEGANNYTTWCTYVKAVLKGQGLHGHITGATQRPVPTASATSTVGSAEVEADTKAVAEWERKDDKAQSIILLGVTPAMLGCIAGDMTARQMWDKLATQCHRKDMATRISLMQQLFSTRLRPADSVDQHIRAMAEIRDRLINIGKPLDDAVAAIALLLSVPAEVPQWEMWLRSHTASAKDPTWDDVSADMRAEASLQQQRDRTLMQASADAAAVVAYAAATKGGRQTTPPRAGRPYCTHCNKQGHVAATCWTLHPDQRKQRQATTEHALAVAVADGEQDAPIPGVGLWHVDSGASSHLTGCRAWFTELHSCAPCTVVAANHGTLTCTQRGTVTLNTERGRIHVRDVLYVPSLGVNLLSVSAIVNAGMRVRFTKGGCRISTSRNKLIVQAVARNNIYSIHAAPQPSESAYSVTAGTSSPLSWVVAHGRMGHLNTRDLQALHDKGMALGTTAPSDGSPADIDHCAGCLAGKSHRIPFPAQASHRASQPLELVHSDVCGHIREGDKSTPKRYIVTFIDDYSRFTWVAITSNKSGDTLLNQFVRYKVWAERYTGFQVKALRTDGGGEYNNDRFTTYLTVMGIQREMSTARTPQQNGVAERANRTIMEAARSMLHASGLPYTFWEHAVMTAVYLRNRSPTKALTDATPYEAWRGEKPDLSHLRVFGCRAYMHLDKTKRNKLQPRSIPVIFVGYATEAKAWLVYDPVASGSKKTHVSRDVTFHESVAGSTLLTAAVSAAAPAAIEGKTSNSSSSLVQPAAELVDAEKPSSIDHVLIVSDTDSDNDNDSDVEPAVLPVQRFVAAEPSAVDSVPVAPVAAASPPVDQPVASLPAVSQPASLPGLSSASPRKRVSRAERALRELASHNTLGNSERTSAQPPVAGNFVFAFAASTVATEPLSYKEAMRSPYRAQWEQAMREELDSINANHTYTLVPLPAGRRAIGSKWVYKIKRHADGSVDRFKARLVAKGYAQRHGIDFTETFAPVVRFSSLRAILAIAAAKDYEVHQMDVKTAFLNGDLDEDIYMHQPDGHSASGGEQQQLVWKLEKSLYGLKQAGRAWNKTMDAALIGMGFRPTHSDSCVYVMRDDSSVMYLLVYVDDLLLVASDSAQLTSVKAQLSSRFEMKDMGEAQFILGVQITRDRARRRLYLSQAEYIRTVLERFDMLECKPAASPMATGVKLLKTQLASGASGSIDSTVMDSTPYASAVGALMYAALVTRPDIAFAVTSLCQFMSAPSLSHWQAAKRVMRYLQGTRHRELAYGWAGGQDKQLYGYSDSDWGNDVNDRRSFTGWVFLLHDSAVSWQSCKQPTVALSSTEAEYMAATQATREAVWWRSFMTELGYRPSAATTVHSDSQGAIALSINPEHHKRTKHIDIQHHYVREQVEAGSVVLPHIGTELMVADVLTKPLSAERHTELTGKMGVRAAHSAV
jgi:transposase InsO family protein